MGLREGIVLANHIIDATDNGAGNDKWTSTTIQTWTVPAGKRWYFLGGTVLNSVDATATLDMYDAQPKIVFGLASIATPGAATRVQYPDADIGYVHRPIAMDAGWSIKLTMGAAQGAAAEASCVVIEVSVL